MLAGNADAKCKLDCFTYLLYNFQLAKNMKRIIADDEVVYILVKIKISQKDAILIKNLIRSKEYGARLSEFPDNWKVLKKI